jgi:Delta7-sterol 5-desaturase
LHHTYKQPTAFSVTAIHPAEFLFFQCILISPMFLVPTHWSEFTLLFLRRPIQNKN